MEVSKDEVLARNMPRVTSFCKESGMTEAEAWKTWGAEKEFGPFTGPADWNKFLVGANIFAGMQNFTKDEKDTFVIDSGIGCKGTIPGIESVLGLPHIENPDLAKVTEVNHKRQGENMRMKPIY